MSTTIEALFNEELAEYLRRENSRFLEYEDSFTHETQRPDVLVSQLKMWEARVAEIEYLEPSPFSPTVQSRVASVYESQIANHNARRADIVKDFEFKKLEVKRKIRDQINEAQTAIQEYQKEKLKELEPLIRAQQTLKDMRPDIDEIFKLYGISKSDVGIDTTLLSSEEVHELMLDASYAVKSIAGATSLFQRAALILYWPSTIPKEEPNYNVYRISYSIAFILAAYLLKPYFFAVFGLFYILNSLTNVSRVQERKYLLQVAYALGEVVDVNKLVYQTPQFQSLQDKLHHLESLDGVDDCVMIDMEMDEVLTEFDSQSPRVEMERELDEWATYAASEAFEARTGNARRNIGIAKANLIAKYREALEIGERLLKAFKTSAAFLGEAIPESSILKRDLRIGALRYKDERVCEAIATLPNECIFFDSKDLADSLDFCKLLLSNYLCNVKEGSLKVDIADPGFLGIEFSEFMRRGTESIIKQDTGGIPGTFKTLQALALERTKLLRGKTIDEHNAECDKIGKLPVEYRLVIIRTGIENVAEDLQFKAFLEFCCNIGIILWIFPPANLGDKKALDAVRLLRQNMTNYSSGQLVTSKGEGMNRVSREITPYEYTPELGSRVGDLVAHMLEVRKVTIINYETQYREPVIPDDKIWTYSTRDGIELRLGFEDGDPSRPMSITLGDRPVHALLAGSTGSGKSATLNFILANLFHMYPPSELNIYMMDFKRVEFALYAGESHIPHAEIIAGSKDPEYASSIFERAVKVLEQREKENAKLGFQNIRERNDYMRQQGRKSEVWPQILVLIDEFQDMFNMANQRVLGNITKFIGQIAKKGRALGVHLFFTSQSMSGTISKDILDQFSLRLCLNVTEDVSNMILGSNVAAKMPKLGWLVSNQDTGGAKTPTRMWRVPYISNDQIKTYIKKLQQRCVDTGEIDRNPKFFDEEEFDNESSLHAWNKQEGNLSDDRLFITGERTIYTENKAPNYFSLAVDDYEHILAVTGITESYYRIVSTLLSDAKSRKNRDILIHCADSIDRKRLNLDAYVDDWSREILTGDITPEELLDNLLELAEGPQASKPLYIFLVSWDKAPGIGRDGNQRVKNKLSRLLDISGKKDIHVILTSKEVNPVSDAIPKINHKLSGYLPGREAFKISSEEDVSKLTEGVCSYFSGKNFWKSKLYEFEYADLGTKESWKV